jgi:hypothetical protein
MNAKEEFFVKARSGRGLHRQVPLTQKELDLTGWDLTKPHFTNRYWN